MSARRTFDVDPFNGYEYVDMGLPSGIVWAKNNLGASSDTIGGTGYRIQFGDITDKTNVTTNWSNYIYATSSINGTMSSSINLLKYNDDDGLISLEPSDDAPHMIMGGNWFTPSPDNCNELIENSDITYSGMNPTIIIFTSRINNKQLKFIAGGVKIGTSNSKVANGYYLTNSIDTNKKNARILTLSPPISSPAPTYNVGSNQRCYGYLVKPINTYFAQ